MKEVCPDAWIWNHTFRHPRIHRSSMRSSSMAYPRNEGVIRERRTYVPTSACDSPSELLTPALFITSIHRLCTPLEIKHSATALTCSPCTMICFKFGLHGSGCTAVEDAHAFLSPSARLSAPRLKISKSDICVTLWLRRRMMLTEIGFGVLSLSDYEQPEFRLKYKLKH